MNNKSKLLDGVATVPLAGFGDQVQMVPTPPNAAKNMPRIMLAIPSGRTWEARTGTAIAGIATFTALHGYTVGITNYEGSMITKQRNDLVRIAKQGGFETMGWIDSDMIWPPNTFVRLDQHKKDIVGATYNKRVAPYQTLGRLKGTKPVGEIEGGLHEAIELPGGCMLVRMSVYERLSWPWYWETYDWEGEDGIDALKNFLRDNYPTLPPAEALEELDNTPHLAKWLNDWRATLNGGRFDYFSEDLNFCRKARKHNYKLWCDLDLTFQGVHLGTLDVTCKKPEAPSPVVAAQM